jgi:hypothetical protein
MPVLLRLFGMGIYAAFLYFKYSELQIDLTPSPDGEGWGEENKINCLYFD